jgi:ATP-binding cassette subfamily G (WHITE) protein 2 (SNQ2)
VLDLPLAHVCFLVPSFSSRPQPTSGLDGQSSFLIVSFLKKLAAAGQAVRQYLLSSFSHPSHSKLTENLISFPASVCTIHQPSASLFAEFDSLLLLKAGGKTVYFGKIDELKDYFKSEGVHMPKHINPAERSAFLLPSSSSLCMLFDCWLMPFLATSTFFSYLQ